MKNFRELRATGGKLLMVLAIMMVVVGSVSAATTITTNIATGGSLSVTGASTLTGLTTMVYASSTTQSITGDFLFGGFATTSAANGNFLTGGKVAIGTTSVTVSSHALDVTGTTTSSNGIVIGSVGSPISRFLFGTCGVDFPAFSAAVGSSTIADCSATGVTTSDKIFVALASSTMDNPYFLLAASSTSASVIQIQVSNASTTSAGTTWNPAPVQYNWMSIR